MTSLLGRLLPLFIGLRRIEDLFTETVARLFERRPELCLSWLDELDLITPVSGEDQRYISVSTQKSFVALDEHGIGSRPDLIVEVHHTTGDTEVESSKDIVMIESKIGSGEGEDQLRRYAEQLMGKMTGTRKTLVYMTRAYDPKDKTEVCSGLHDVEFEQLRWHDFYRFLQTVEKDALIEEVMLFMEEQGMARSYRLSTTDLMALSGVPRAFEFFDETLDGEVKAELESFAGNKTKRESSSVNYIRLWGSYYTVATLHGADLQCLVGYRMRTSDGYPRTSVTLQARPKAMGRNISVAAMKKMALKDGWESSSVDNPASWAGVSCEVSLADILAEEDHVSAIKRFFIESIQQLKEELTEFKKENPDLPWNGGS